MSQTANIFLITTPRSASTSLYNLLLQNPLFTSKGSQQGKVFIHKERAWAFSPIASKIGKVITVSRPIDDIRASWIKLGLNENDADTETYHAESVQNAMAKQEGLHLTYEEVTEDIENTLDKIYGFLDLERYPHDIYNIVRVDDEPDIYPNQHIAKSWKIKA